MHIAVFLFGFTAILGKLITLKEIALVWNRLWIAVLGLLFIPGVIRGIQHIPAKKRWTFAGIGVIVALHWITFYGSIKIGNSASITLACFATTTLFTSFLEPLITKSKIKPIEVLIGAFVILGIVLLSGVGEYYYKAIAVGLLSALLAALFSVLNKKHIIGFNSISISVIELAAGFLFISLIMPFSSNYFPQENWLPQGTDWPWILTLGLLCTSLAYVLALSSLKELSAFVSNLSINLEPVYGILLAIVILGEAEDLNVDFFLGTSIILLAVILHPILNRLDNQRRKKKGIT